MYQEITQELICEILSGKTHKFKIVVDTYENMLFDLALRLICNMQESEDLVQKIFIKTYKNLDKYNSKYKFNNWIYTIAINTIKNHIRRKGIIKWLSLDFEGGNNDAYSKVPAKDDNVEENLQKKEFSIEIGKIINSLPLKLKQVFVLHYIHDKDLKSIAGICSLTTNAVALRLMRAKDIIRTQIETKRI